MLVSALNPPPPRPLHVAASLPWSTVSLIHNCPSASSLLDHCWFDLCFATPAFSHPLHALPDPHILLLSPLPPQSAGHIGQPIRHHWNAKERNSEAPESFATLQSPRTLLRCRVVRFRVGWLEVAYVRAH